MGKWFIVRTIIASIVGFLFCCYFEKRSIEKHLKNQRLDMVKVMKANSIKQYRNLNAEP